MVTGFRDKVVSGKNKKILHHSQAFAKYLENIREQVIKIFLTLTLKHDATNFDK